VLVRVAAKDGGATAGFAAAERRAKGVAVSGTTGSDGTTTRGETLAHYGKAVSGLGDQAFCTKTGLTGTVGEGETGRAGGTAPAG